MEAASSSETSVTIFWLTWHHIVHNLNLYQTHCENLKSHKYQHPAHQSVSYSWILITYLLVCSFWQKVVHSTKYCYNSNIIKIISWHYSLPYCNDATSQVPMSLTNKNYAVEPALCMGVEIQVTFCRWKNERHGDYIHLFTCTHKTTCSQQKIVEFSIPWNIQ